MKIFTPCKIGSLELKNRLVMLPMHMSWAPDGFVDRKLVEYYKRRAAGGVGMIIVGGCAIDRAGAFDSRMIRLDGEGFIPGLRSLTGAVQSEGAKIMAQLYQAGRYSSSRATGTQAVAPSPLASKMTGETPRELSLTEIEGIIASFAQAAKNAQAAGFDGVEILASAGYLISQFLSPVTNKREDRYGGDLWGRMTFGLEVARAVRAAVGPACPVLVRVAGNDFVPGGHSNEEAKAFCRALEKEGVDGFNVTGGWHESTVPQITMYVPPGAYRYLARGIKEAVSLPVIACNRINSPDLAEEILKNGEADFVGMVRALLADPDLPKKAANGNKESIRPCIGCNQSCLDNIFTGKPCKCTVNPEAGREYEFRGDTAEGEAASVDRPLKILVIGAGAAGLEYARNAAVKGHRVTVWEEAETLGGQLALAAAPPERRDFFRLRDYLICECMDRGVNLRCGSKADSANVLEAVQLKGYDRVVIATGAKPMRPAFPGLQGAGAVQAWEVLSGEVGTGRKVVIVGGGAVGLETAHYLAAQGTLSSEEICFLLTYGAESSETLKDLVSRGSKEITVVEMQKGFGRDIGVSSRWILMSSLKRCRVGLLDETKVLSLSAQGVSVESKGEERFIAADTIVLAVGSRPGNELYEQLKEKLPHLVLIGDAAKPAKVTEAMEQAYEAARALPAFKGRQGQ